MRDHLIRVAAAGVMLLAATAAAVTAAVPAAAGPQLQLVTGVSDYDLVSEKEALAVFAAALLVPPGPPPATWGEVAVRCPGAGTGGAGRAAGDRSAP